MTKQISLPEAVLIAIGVIGMLFFVLGATTIPAGGSFNCQTKLIESTASDFFFYTSGHKTCFQMEADIDGDTPGTQQTYSVCNDADTDTCKTHPFDTNSDGVPDSPILNGETFPLQQRLHCIEGATVVYANTTSFVEVGSVTHCTVN